MAKGRKCPYCKATMYADSEKKEPMGSTVVYICRNNMCKHTEKTFESN